MQNETKNRAVIFPGRRKGKGTRMNNGHPNYQQPAGGHQPGQGMPQPGQRYAPQGGYSGQAPQGYYPPQGQVPQGYAPQGNPQGYAPQGRAPQGQAPYGYPQGQGGYYGAPSGYGQGQGGNYYPPQGAPAQGQQMPYQGYGQQPYPPQQGYGQGYPGQPYPGMYAQPGQQPKPPAKPFPVELVCKIAVFGLLPVLFILSMIFPIVALKWIFIVLAVAGVTFLWVRPILFSNTRLTLTAVYAAAVVVALVSALMAPPADTSNNAQGNGAMDQNSINETLSQIQDATGETPEPGMALQEVTPTPTASLDNDETVSQLKSFFYFWSVNKTNEMVTLCAPSWQSSVEDPTRELFVILANRVPLDYEVEKITGSANDSSRTVTVVANIDKQNAQDPVKYRFSVIMLKENDIWYVDPKSLTTSEAQDTPTPTPTSTPAPTQEVSANTVLYYNTDGGSYYHADPNCQRVAEKYLPLKGTFTYSQINDDPYSKLQPCNICNAPLRQ